MEENKHKANKKKCGHRKKNFKKQVAENQRKRKYSGNERKINVKTGEEKKMKHWKENPTIRKKQGVQKKKQKALDYFIDSN